MLSSFMMDLCLENMHLSDCDKHLMHRYLIPGHYLKLAAGKERDLKQKTESFRSQELLSIDSLYASRGICSDYKIEELDKVARYCAQQRSSSCVEGRNAQLALRHHVALEWHDGFLMPHRYTAEETAKISRLGVNGRSRYLAQMIFT